jgi:hypothetical protein
LAKTKRAPTPPRQCIFCGIARKMSKEHVVAQWMHPILPTSPINKISAVEFKETNPAEWKQFSTARQGNSFNKTTTKVCEVCNNGWMSLLEIEVRSIITPLILGQRASLSPEQQAVLARWGAKTGTVCSATYRDSAIPFPNRKWIKEHRAPLLGNWSIWIGSSVGNVFGSGFWVSTSNLYNKTSPPLAPDAHIRYSMTAVTICLGKLILQCFFSTADDQTAAYTPMIKIYPTEIKEIVWPLQMTWDDNHIFRLTTAFIKLQNAKARIIS